MRHPLPDLGEWRALADVVPDPNRLAHQVIGLDAAAASKSAHRFVPSRCGETLLRSSPAFLTPNARQIKSTRRIGADSWSRQGAGMPHLPMASESVVTRVRRPRDFDGAVWLLSSATRRGFRGCRLRARVRAQSPGHPGPVLLRCTPRAGIGRPLWRPRIARQSSRSA
jgi:hypothetical protein